MTILPQTPAFNPWQQALYSLSSGLMAAGAPGGFRNFGMGVGQGAGQFQDQQSRLLREQMLQKQFDREERDYEAKQAKTAAEQKRMDALRSSAGGLLQTYDDTDTSNDAFGALSPAQLSLARLQLESNPEGLLETLGGWTKASGPADAPTIKDFIDGDRIIQKQWNGTEWIPVGEGGRYAPKTQQEMSIDFNGDGKPDFVMGGGALKMTEDQSKAGVQLQLGLDADAYLDKNEAALTSLVGNIAGRGGTLGNYVKTDEYRQAEQQAAILAEGYFRSQTGAAAPESEIDRMVRQIVPVPGDDPGTIALKRQTRKTWINAMKLRAGPAGQVDVTPNAAAPTPAVPPVQTPNRVKVDAEGNVIP